jgi:hypothetical protein
VQYAWVGDSGWPIEGILTLATNAAYGPVGNPQVDAPSMFIEYVGFNSASAHWIQFFEAHLRFTYDDKPRQREIGFTFTLPGGARRRTSVGNFVFRYLDSRGSNPYYDTTGIGNADDSSSWMFDHPTAPGTLLNQARRYYEAVKPGIFRHILRIDASYIFADYLVYKGVAYAEVVWDASIGWTPKAAIPMSNTVGICLARPAQADPCSAPPRVQLRPVPCL